MTAQVEWHQKFHWLYGIEEYLKFDEHPDYDRFIRIRDALLHGEYWSIRDLVLQEIKRGDFELTEQFVNTILLHYLHQDLTDIDHRQVIQYVSHCIDSEFVRNISSWSIKWGPKANLTDHFSRGQIASKTWMVKELRNIIDNRKLGNVVMYGGWYATIAAVLFQNFDIVKYYNLDMDDAVLKIADDFNYRTKNHGKFESMYCDVNQLVYCERSVKLPNGVNVEPTVVINTSCEHMTDEWFYNLPDGQFVVLQTNNYFSNEQHINCVNNVQEALDKYRFTDVLYAGELDNMIYDRYMIIGIK